VFVLSPRGGLAAAWRTGFCELLAAGLGALEAGEGDPAAVQWVAGNRWWIAYGG